MKYALVALLVAFNPAGTWAQKNVFFGDAGISLARFYPGASVTYNHNLARWFGVGAGAQAYDFHATRTNYQFIPALFGELRFNIRPRKKSQLFLFLDIGADFYKHNDYYWHQADMVYDVRKDDGIYTGLGIGYFRRKTKRGWGPYVSLKFISNSYNVDEYNIVSSKQNIAVWADATFVFSAGFKF